MSAVPVCLTCALREMLTLLFASAGFYLLSAARAARLQGRSSPGRDGGDACGGCLGTRGAGTSPGLSAIKIDQECCMKGNGVCWVRERLMEQPRL